MEIKDKGRKEYDKSYYAKNRKKILDRKKEYYTENRDKILGYANEYYHTSKEEIKKWRNENKEKYAAYQKKYRQIRSTSKKIEKAFIESSIQSFPHPNGDIILVKQYLNGKLVKQFNVQK